MELSDVAWRCTDGDGWSGRTVRHSGVERVGSAYFPIAAKVDGQVACDFHDLGLKTFTRGRWIDVENARARAIRMSDKDRVMCRPREEKICRSGNSVVERRAVSGPS